jgi:hypothetical protein
MIVFSRLGIRGNLGNQMFQIASTIGIAKLMKHEFGFPVWHYSSFFKNALPQIDAASSFEGLKEHAFTFQDWEIKENVNYDLNGWLQTERYFDVKATKKAFEFDSLFMENIRKNNEHLFVKKTILISVRRGDFLNHPHFFQLTYKYYFLALVNNFPDWKERNLVFTSDDISYCKRHFVFIKNSLFLEDLSPIEQLALGSECSDFIISNSTFSWWMAWLGEKEHSKIIRPIKNFRGVFAADNDDSDYFPERWISFDEKKFSISNAFWGLKVKGNYLLLRDDLVHLWTVFVKQSKSFVKQILGRK